MTWEILLVTAVGALFLGGILAIVERGRWGDFGTAGRQASAAERLARDIRQDARPQPDLAQPQPVTVQPTRIVVSGRQSRTASLARTTGAVDSVSDERRGSSPRVTSDPRRRLWRDTSVALGVLAAVAFLASYVGPQSSEPTGGVLSATATPNAAEVGGSPSPSSTASPTPGVSGPSSPSPAH